MLNLDVIIHVITWFITLVADHEHVKQELQDEVAANRDNLLEYLAKTDTHLHRCFLESMRVRPFSSKTFRPTSRSQTDSVCVCYSLYNRGIFVHPQELSRRHRKTQCEFERSSLQHWKDLLIRTSNTTQTQILVDVLAINVRNPFWGANSDAFDPSRLKNIKQSDVCSPHTQTLSQPPRAYPAM
jgi:hypothetical protein